MFERPIKYILDHNSIKPVSKYQSIQHPSIKHIITMGNLQSTASKPEILDNESKYRMITDHLKNITGYCYYSRYHEHIGDFLKIFDQKDLTNCSRSRVVEEILGLYHCYGGNKISNQGLTFFMASALDGSQKLNPSAYVNIGDYYLKTNNKREALFYYMLAYEQKYIYAFERLARWYHLVEKDWVRAIGYYEEAIREHETNSKCEITDVFSDYGNLCCNKGMYEKAISLFEKACAREKSTKNLNELAYCLFLAGRPCEALTSVIEAYGVDNDLTMLVEGNARMCLKQIASMNDFKHIKGLEQLIESTNIDLSDLSVREIINDVHNCWRGINQIV